MEFKTHAISPVKTYSKLLADIDDRPYKTWSVLKAQALVAVVPNYLHEYLYVSEVASSGVLGSLPLRNPGMPLAGTASRRAIFGIVPQIRHCYRRLRYE